jgi:hypothetical protein
MSFAARQARLRVTEQVERRVRRFRSDEDLWPVRVPVEPLSLDDVVREALPEGHGQFDLRALRARTLLWLEWEDGSTWELWVLMLPSGLKVFCDSGGGEHRILATGGRHSSAETDRLFLERLAESAGQRFGIEMAGGAPTTVRAQGIERERLVDFFLHLLEVTGEEQSVRARLPQADTAVGAGPEGTDFRHTVASWLTLVASNTGAGPGNGSISKGANGDQPLHFAAEDPGDDKDEYED